MRNHQGNWPWDNPHEKLEKMEHSELEMLRWVIRSQVGIGNLLLDISEQQEQIMADLAGLQSELDELSADAQAASDRVAADLSALSAQVGDLMDQVAALTAGAVSQDQIDALAAQADAIDSAVDAIDPAIVPAPEPEPAP